MSAWGFTSVILLVASTAASATPPPGRVSTTPAEIVITSQSLVFRNQENTALFEGKVVMTKGDFIMRADQMIVHFAGSPGPSKSGNSGTTPQTSSPTPDLPTFGNRAVSLIDATGNVVMQQGNKKAKSHKAVYHQLDDKLVLTGDPEAWEEGYRVTGSKMTMYLKEDRSIVEGSRVVINNAEHNAQ